MAGKHNDFVSQEYSSLYQMVLTGWTISYTLLTGGIVVFGYLIERIGRSSDVNPWPDPYACMLLTLPPILAVIVGQITTAGYLAAFRMVEIARIYKVCDFWTRMHCLRRYPQHSPKDRLMRKWDVLVCAATFPMIVVIAIGTILSGVIVVSHYGWNYETVIWLIAAFISSGVALL